MQRKKSTNKVHGQLPVKNLLCWFITSPSRASVKLVTSFQSKSLSGNCSNLIYSNQKIDKKKSGTYITNISYHLDHAIL